MVGVAVSRGTAFVQPRPLSTQLQTRLLPSRVTIDYSPRLTQIKHLDISMKRRSAVRMHAMQGACFEETKKNITKRSQ